MWETRALTILVLILAFQIAAMNHFFDEECDNQLSASTEAASKQKLWALKRKFQQANNI